MTAPIFESAWSMPWRGAPRRGHAPGAKRLEGDSHREVGGRRVRASSGDRHGGPRCVFFAAACSNPARHLPCVTTTTAHEIERRRGGAPRKPRTMASSLGSYLVMSARARGVVEPGA